MTEEEAIKRIKYLQQDECNCEECTKDKEAYEIVLNLIKNKSNLIEYWKNGFVRELEKNRENIIEIIEQDKRINELEKTLDERFIHITGARTVYARLMSLDKEIIVRDDLKLRNEIEQNIKDEEKLKVELKKKDKIIEKMAERVYLKKEEYECVRENQRNNIHKSFEDCIIEYFEKEEV